MKTRMTIFTSLLLAGFAFTSCEDDNNNYTPNEEIVNVLYEKYPNAQRVDWELQHDHYVADFRDNNTEKEAWFNPKGEWVMTKSDILFKNLPQAIQTTFGESEYKDWRVDDVDMLERVEMETMYVIEVEKGKQEFDLFYAENGTLIKAVEDLDNNYQPNTIPEVLKNFINNKYPQATIVDIEIEKGITEIDILHENKAKELHFNSANEWLYTTWEVKEREIQEIADNVKAANPGFHVDDIDYKESADNSKVYIFELEQGDHEKYVTVDMEGNIVG